MLATIKKYYIITKNIYNFNKKGFLIGFGRCLKRVITLKAFKLGRVTKNKQDRNHEFISLLAYILAIRKAIPPLLIYKGASRDL